MLDIKKSIFDNIKTAELGDPLYDCLPRLTHKAENEIFTICRIPPRYFTKIEGNKSIKVETSPAILRVFLVFDINNNLYPDCIEKGTCVIHKYDTIVVIRMDENYRMDAHVEFYFDLTDIVNKCLDRERSLAGTSYCDVAEDIMFKSYYELYNMNKTASAIDKQITDTALLGGLTLKEFVSYDANTHTKTVVEKNVPTEGLLSKISTSLIHYE